MASAFSHAVVAIALGAAYPRKLITWSVLALGAVCAVVEDLDVIGFHFGIQYGDLWGHRGMTHSLLFAAVMSAAITAIVYLRKPTPRKLQLFSYLFLCAASHGLLDAMTDGGLGVAFFSPFNTTRYYFAFRPIVVSPISLHRFLSGRGIDVLLSEFRWIWLPSLGFWIACLLWRKLRPARSSEPKPSL